MHCQRRNRVTRWKYLPLNINYIFIWQEWLPRESSKTTNKISTLHQFLFILTSNEEYMEDYIANTRHNLYLLHIKPIELTTNEKEKNSVSTQCGRHQKGCSTAWNFLGSELGHSPKRIVKLLGREQRSAPHTWLRGYKPPFHTRLTCHLSKTKVYLA